jgi:hypothetical protein
MMFAIRSGDNPTKQWHTEKRNVLNDLKNIFGEDIRYIDAKVTDRNSFILGLKCRAD